MPAIWCLLVTEWKRQRRNECSASATRELCIRRRGRNRMSGKKQFQSLIRLALRLSERADGSMDRWRDQGGPDENISLSTTSEMRLLLLLSFQGRVVEGERIRSRKDRSDLGIYSENWEFCRKLGNFLYRDDEGFRYCTKFCENERFGGEIKNWCDRKLDGCPSSWLPGESE